MRVIKATARKPRAIANAFCIGLTLTAGGCAELDDEDSADEDVASAVLALSAPAKSCGIGNYSTSSTRVVTVKNATEFKTAMDSAKGGDVIKLAAGDFGWVDINNKKYNGYVTIKGSANARFKHIGLKNVENVQFDGVQFRYGSAVGESWKPKIIEIQTSKNIRIVNSSIVGNSATTLYHDDIPDTGVRAVGSSNIVIAGSSFSHVSRAVMFQHINGYTIEANSLVDIGCDGLFFQHAHNGVIKNNYLASFHPFIYAAQGSTCHSDFIQFDAGKGRHANKPSSNVTIRGNVMLQGPKGSTCSGRGSECGAVQGVFLGGAVGEVDGIEHVFENITISHNVYCASGKNGLSGANVRNVHIRDNAHYSCPPPFGDTHMSNIYLSGKQTNSSISGNVTGRVSGQDEALARARGLSKLDNCVLKGIGSGTPTPNPPAEEPPADPGVGSTVTLELVHSAKCITVTGGAGDGANIDQRTCDGAANQRWTVRDVGGGRRELKAAHSGKCMAVAGDGNKANYQQATCNGSANQRFTLVSAGSGEVQLRAEHSGSCMDVYGASTASGANVHQWSCSSGANQRVRLKPAM
jgi:hypothetical protein